MSKVQRGGLAVVCGALLLAALAGAAPGASWSLQTSPSNGTHDVLTGVGCAFFYSCHAVGSYRERGGATVTLSEFWKTGAEEDARAPWTLETTPNPAGATESAFASASCAPTVNCLAVGAYRERAGTRKALSELWNEREWAVQTTPTPTGATSSGLNGVSCLVSASSACEAVGSYTERSGVVLSFAERWNGTEWSLQTTPNPAGGTGVTLAGVACTEVSACTAVGSYTEGSGTVLPLAERWNGTEWSIQTTPHPTFSTRNVLKGVGCTTARSCDAVGSYAELLGTVVTLAEHWNGTAWAVQTTPNPTGATASSLNGVACYPAEFVRACEAVGSYTERSGVVLTLAERWNLTEWALQTTPNRETARSSVLLGVWCRGETACHAVGTQDTEVTLAERFF